MKEITILYRDISKDYVIDDMHSPSNFNVYHAKIKKSINAVVEYLFGNYKTRKCRLIIKGNIPIEKEELETLIKNEAKMNKMEIIYK